MAVSEVKTVAFESWLGTLKLCNGSRAKIRNILSAIYSHGMRWEFTNRNPITLVRQSAKRRHASCVLDVEEIRALLAELKGMYRVMVFVAATTGLRVSELLALRWQDCDYMAGEIHLTRGIVRQRETMMKRRPHGSRFPWSLDSLTCFFNGERSVRTTSQTTSCSPVSRKAAYNRFGRIARWRSTFAPLQSEQASVSVSAGMSFGIPSER
jgi:integrase